MLCFRSYSCGSQHVRLQERQPKLLEWALLLRSWVGEPLPLRIVMELTAIDSVATQPIIAQLGAKKATAIALPTCPTAMAQEHVGRLLETPSVPLVNAAHSQ